MWIQKELVSPVFSTIICGPTPPNMAGNIMDRSCSTTWLYLTNSQVTQLLKMSLHMRLKLHTALVRLQLPVRFNSPSTPERGLILGLMFLTIS